MHEVRLRVQGPSSRVGLGLRVLGFRLRVGLGFRVSVWHRVLPKVWFWF